MRIGLDVSVLSDKQKTGIAVYTYSLIDALLKINRKDEFVLFGISTLETFDYLKNLEFKKYPNVKLVINKLPAKLFRTVFILWQKLNWPLIETFIGDVDIFHSFNWFFPPQKNGKKVATVFDMTPTLFPQFHHQRTVQLEKIRLERIRKYADLVISISENSRSDFLKFSTKSNVGVIYPAADQLDLTYSSEKIKKVLKKYNLKRGYFLSVATLEPRKNLKVLLNVYLRGQFDKELVIVGAKGWGDDEIHKLVMTNHQVRMLGYIPDEELPILYRGASCFICPSFYEGFGLPVLEAMTFSIPTICSNTSSLTEVGGDAVLYIDPKSEESIKEAIGKIENDDNLKKRLIEKGLQQADKFSWRKSAEKLNLLYQQL